MSNQSRARGAISIACLVLAGAGCSEPVPDLPPATTPAKSRAALTEELPEGAIDAFGIRMPAKSSVKRQTRSTMTLDVPTEMAKTAAYLKGHLSSFKTETRKGQVVFTEAIPKSTPDREVRITLRPTSLTTEVVVVSLPSGAALPTEGDPSARPEEEPSEAPAEH